jgi:maleate isomerase
MSNVLPETSYRLARAVVEENPGAEAVYFPCARWPVIDNIARLEAELGIPVVTSVQSMLWAALKGFEWWEPVVGYGRLLEGLSRNGHNRA